MGARKALKGGYGIPSSFRDAAGPCRYQLADCGIGLVGQVEIGVQANEIHVVPERHELEFVASGGGICPVDQRQVGITCPKRIDDVLLPVRGATSVATGPGKIRQLGANNQRADVILGRNLGVVKNKVLIAGEPGSEPGLLLSGGRSGARPLNIASPPSIEGVHKGLEGHRDSLRLHILDGGDHRCVGGTKGDTIDVAWRTGSFWCNGGRSVGLHIPDRVHCGVVGAGCPQVGNSGRALWSLQVLVWLIGNVINAVIGETGFALPQGFESASDNRQPCQDSADGEEAVVCTGNRKNRFHGFTSICVRLELGTTIRSLACTPLAPPAGMYAEHSSLAGQPFAHPTILVTWI